MKHHKTASGKPASSDCPQKLSQFMKKLIHILTAHLSPLNKQKKIVGKKTAKMILNMPFNKKVLLEFSPVLKTVHELVTLLLCRTQY